MRVLIANLKHLYQRTGLLDRLYVHWPAAVALVGQRFSGRSCIALASRRAHRGCCGGGISRGVINKPFARCLPGHWTAVRRTTFLVASAVGIVVGILFMRNAGIGIWRSPVVFCAAASVGMTFCLLMGALLLTPWKMKSPAAGILFCLAGVMIAMVAGSRVLYVPGWMVLSTSVGSCGRRDYRRRAGCGWAGGSGSDAFSAWLCVSAFSA